MNRAATAPALRGATLLLAHASLLIAVGVWALGLALPSPWRAVLLGLGVIPLLLATPPLVARRRRSYPWIALLLVVYIGGSVVEVIASQRSGWAPVAALAAALIELALLIRLLRAAPPAPHG